MVPPTPSLPPTKKFILKKIRINVSPEINNDWYLLNGCVNGDGCWCIILGYPTGVYHGTPTPGLPPSKKFGLKKILINVSVEIENLKIVFLLNGWDDGDGCWCIILGYPTGVYHGTPVPGLPPPKKF